MEDDIMRKNPSNDNVFMFYSNLDNKYLTKLENC